MKNIYYVYALTDPRKDNEPFYIGKGKGERCNHHLLPREKGINKFKDSVIEKIKESNLIPGIEILERNLEESEAYSIERRLIENIGRRITNTGPLTNIAEGGIGGPDVTGIKRSKETRKKLSEGQLGEKNHRYGKPLSDDLKKRQLESRLKTMERYKKEGKPWSNKGKSVSEEAKAKCRATWAKKKAEREAKNEEHWLKNKKQSAEHIQKRLKTINTRLKEGKEYKYGQHVKGKKQSPEHIKKRIEARMKTIRKQKDSK